MAILGISGSPIVNGNTDRMVKAVLEKSGGDTKFVSLSSLNYQPCRACAHLCAQTNLCPIKDDLFPLFQEIRDAEALVLGSPIHNGNMTAWMYSFISRLWCFNHVKRVLQGKPVLFVSSGISSENPEKCQILFNDTYIREHKPKIIGEIYYKSDIPPCLKCGAGSYCHKGGLWYMLGKDENALKEFEFTPDKFHRWEDEPAMVEKIEIYGKALSEI